MPLRRRRYIIATISISGMAIIPQSGNRADGMGFAFGGFKQDPDHGKTNQRTAASPIKTL